MILCACRTWRSREQSTKRSKNVWKVSDSTLKTTTAQSFHTLTRTDSRRQTNNWYTWVQTIYHNTTAEHHVLFIYHLSIIYLNIYLLFIYYVSTIYLQSKLLANEFVPFHAKGKLETVLVADVWHFSFPLVKLAIVRVFPALFQLQRHVGCSRETHHAQQS